MTDAQAKRFYFPAWNRALKARWVRDRGTMLPREGAPALDLADQVEAIATSRAARRAGVVTAEDLRHGAHVVALGRDLSSKDLTNAQTDRVVALFDLLADPDDLGARMRWDSPNEDARRRLEWFAGNSGFSEAYVAAVCSSKFSTRDWRQLNDAQLRQLVVTLKNRARAKRNSHDKTAATGTATGTASRVIVPDGKDHADPCAVGAPACDVGMPGQEDDGDPF
ncbi:MAG: hypothetical protein U1G08_17765 [Verrucomicrobiota bacterium]